MGGADLPIEIFTRICQFATPSTLAATCRASKLAGCIATPVLYGSIHTSKELEPFIRLFSTLSRHPDLAKHVKFLQINNCPDVYGCLPGPLERMMGRALRNMVNREHFFDCLLYMSFIWPMMVRHHLHVLSLRTYSTLIPRPNTTIDFLHAASKLTHLRVPSCLGGYPQSRAFSFPEFLPLLVTIHCSENFFPKIATNRPLEDVTLTCSHETSAGDLVQMLRSTSKLSEASHHLLSLLHYRRLSCVSQSISFLCKSTRKPAGLCGNPTSSMCFIISS